MAFQVEDYHDLVRLLQQHPEWREELRHLLLSPDVLELPQIVRELAEAQKRTEQQMRELIEVQKRSEERLADAEERSVRVEERLADVAERLVRVEERLADVEERLVRVEERLVDVEERLVRVEERLVNTEERLVYAEERLTRLEQAVAELVEAQKRSEERLALLEQNMAKLAEAQRKTEEKLQKLTERVDVISIQVDELRGDMLEVRYRQRAFSYFGKIISRAQVVDLQEIWEEHIEPNLGEEEREDLLALDLLIYGKLSRLLMERMGFTELWLAVEVSGLVDQNDVKRARRRADLLSKAGLRVLPVAAGRDVTQGAAALASEMGVVLQKDGGLLYVEEGLARLRA
ncbi:MAG: hypothetical protein NZ840_05795 [Anaerolineales bacterium]|nr:hypothetical protein [Anaerolineales bacterium]MDW8161551.1 hypothetical protein [Anaerolineales bacterium]